MCGTGVVDVDVVFDYVDDDVVVDGVGGDDDDDVVVDGVGGDDDDDDPVLRDTGSCCEHGVFKHHREICIYIYTYIRMYIYIRIYIYGFLKVIVGENYHKPNLD
jgi:hypothetical protein